MDAGGIAMQEQLPRSNSVTPDLFHVFMLLGIRYHSIPAYRIIDFLWLNGSEG